MKDYFSANSHDYQKYRPSYPKEMVKFIANLVPNEGSVWDCGTGNGQLAIELSSYFFKVFATDISYNQLKNAPQKENVFYKIESAEGSSFRSNQFDLVTVAQAIHWFNFEKFYFEVERTLKPGGYFCIVGYSLIQTNSLVDFVIKKLYKNIVGTFWDKERAYLEKNYKTIPFPFEEMESPLFCSVYQWTLNDLMGYLKTWSAVKHYEKEKNENPVESIRKELEESWGEDVKKTVKFSILLRVGKYKL